MGELQNRRLKQLSLGFIYAARLTHDHSPSFLLSGGIYEALPTCPLKVYVPRRCSYCMRYFSTCHVDSESVSENIIHTKDRFSGRNAARERAHTH